MLCKMRILRNMKIADIEISISYKIKLIVKNWNVKINLVVSVIFA